MLKCFVAKLFFPNLDHFCFYFHSYHLVNFFTFVSSKCCLVSLVLSNYCVCFRWCCTNQLISLKMLGFLSFLLYSYCFAVLSSLVVFHIPEDLVTLLSPYSWSGLLNKYLRLFFSTEIGSGTHFLSKNLLMVFCFLMHSTINRFR